MNTTVKVCRKCGERFDGERGAPKLCVDCNRPWHPPEVTPRAIQIERVVGSTLGK